MRLLHGSYIEMQARYPRDPSLGICCRTRHDSPSPLGAGCGAGTEWGCIADARWTGILYHGVSHGQFIGYSFLQQLTWRRACDSVCGVWEWLNAGNAWNCACPGRNLGLPWIVSVGIPRSLGKWIYRPMAAWPAVWPLDPEALSRLLTGHPEPRRHCSRHSSPCCFSLQKLRGAEWKLGFFPHFNIARSSEKSPRYGTQLWSWFFLGCPEHDNGKDTGSLLVLFLFVTVHKTDLGV